MADQIHDVPEVEVTRQDYIVESVQRELAAAAKMLPLITDVSQFALPGHKTISFPKLGSFTVQKLGNYQRADAQALTATEDELNLDQLATVQWIMKKKAELQSKLAFEAALIGRAGSAHARQVDYDILEEMYSGAAVANDVTYNASDIEGNILDIVENLDGQNAPEEGRFVVFRPSEKKLLLKVANFTQADRYGSNVPLVSGELGQAYGLRFVLSNTLTTNFTDAVMMGFHREAVAFGFQMAPTFDEQKAIEYGVGSKRMAVDQLYGLKQVQDGKLVARVKA